MRAFAALVARLESAPDDAQRIDALGAYWSAVPAADAAWSLQLLAGRGIGRRLDAGALRAATCRAADLAPWLFDTCLEASGDWAETVTHLLPPCAHPSDRPLAHWLEGVLATNPIDPPQRHAAHALQWCDELEAPGRELLLQLLLGRWRRLVSDALLQRALSRHAGVDPRLLVLRWPAWRHPRTGPAASHWTALLQCEPASQAERVLPHAFAPLERIDGDATALAGRLGDAPLWIVQQLHGGERAQLVRRDAGTALWPAGGGGAPAAQVASNLPPNTVVEGEWLAEPAPALDPGDGAGPRGVFRITDVLELAGRDLRAAPASQRIAAALELPCGPQLVISAPSARADWKALDGMWSSARARGVDALRLMRRDAGYGEPMALFDWPTPPWRATVLLQSAEHVADACGQACIELGVALWSRRPADAAAVRRALDAAQQGDRLSAACAQLVPIAKLRVALNGDDALGAGWSDWLSQATLQRFGPVRWLRVQRTCEVAFDAIVPTRRRRSGVELRGARFVCWRDELHAAAVDDLLALRERTQPQSP